MGCFPPPSCLQRWTASWCHTRRPSISTHSTALSRLVQPATAPRALTAAAAVLVTPPAFVVTCSSVFAGWPGLQPRCWFFEAVNLFFKTIFPFIMTTSENGSATQLALGTVCVVLNLVVASWLQPYTAWKSDMLSTLCLVCLFAALFGALLLRADFGAAENIDAHSLGLLVMLVSTAPSVCLALLAGEAMWAGTVKLKRLRETDDDKEADDIVEVSSEVEAEPAPTTRGEAAGMPGLFGRTKVAPEDAAPPAPDNGERRTNPAWP